MKSIATTSIQQRASGLALLAVLLTAGCVAINPVADVNFSGDGYVGNERFVDSLQQSLDAGGINGLNATTTNGGIVIRTTEDGRITVRIRKEVRARTESEAAAFASKVIVKVERRGNSAVIFKEYPKPPQGVQVAVSYDVDVPSGIGLSLGTTNGSITVTNASGGLDAATTNGSIRLNGITGPVAAQTTNGNVDARLSRLDGNTSLGTTNGSILIRVDGGAGPITASTTNGSVDVALPRGFSGQLDAQTSNGRVQSDFPLSSLITSSRTRLSGLMGEGGSAKVRLITSNGDIELKVSS